MKSSDMFEVFKRLGEKKVPLLDERAHQTFERDKPLFLQKFSLTGEFSSPHGA